MEDHERKRVQDAIDSINIGLNELQIQVLNNVDAHVDSIKPEEGSKAAVNIFVKRPIANIVNRIRTQTANLSRLTQEVRKA